MCIRDRLTHYLNQALKAKELFKRDKDYLVREGQVIIIDEFTGRAMEGRRSVSYTHLKFMVIYNLKNFSIL